MQELTSGKRPATKRKPPLQQDENSQKKTKKTSTVGSAGYISTFLLVISTLIIYDVIFVLNDVDFQAIKTELVHRVHNQSEAVLVILENLNKIQKDDRIAVLNFIGSTGVGKTFVANILKKHFNPSVYLSSGLVKPSTQEEVLSKFRHTSCRHSLMVFDDLTIRDVDNLLNFIKNIPQELSLLVVCIFNIQETDDKLNFIINYDHFNQISNKFNLAQVPHDVAKFHEFNKEQAGDWIVKQLVLKEIDLQVHSRIVEAVLAGQDVKYHGLKGLSTKLNLQL